MNKLLIASEIESFMLEACVDYIGLWNIIDDIAEQLTSADDARAYALAVVKGLLDRGLLVGNLTQDGGFMPWDRQDWNAVSDRIVQEWQELGHDPSINDIAWFHLPRA